MVSLLPIMLGALPSSTDTLPKKMSSRVFSCDPFLIQQFFLARCSWLSCSLELYSAWSNESGEWKNPYRERQTERHRKSRRNSFLTSWFWQCAGRLFKNSRQNWSLVLTHSSNLQVGHTSEAASRVQRETNAHCSSMSTHHMHNKHDTLGNMIRDHATYDMTDQDPMHEIDIQLW